MSVDLLSPQQVAHLLGIHPRTVRNYVRDGRLAATRVGKQYRIAREDLAAFTGADRESPQVRRHRHVEVSSIIDVDALDPETARRITTGLTATANARPPGGRQRLRVESLYDAGRARLKVIVNADLESVRYFLKLIELYLEDES